MLEIRFYTYSKKENSTKQPDNTVVYQGLNCTLKDNTSLINPVFEIDPRVAITGGSITLLPWQYNYCYVPMFSRYYFIDDWSYDGGLWFCKCHVDPLASWKSDIKNTWSYIARSTRDNNGNILYNGDILDTFYPATAAQATYLNTSITNPFAGSDGVYIVGVINKNSENGTVTYYAFNRVGFKQFTGQLFNYSSGWLNIDITEISENLQKALINPFQYIVSCIYLPVNVSDIVGISDTATTTIYFGWWSVTVSNGARIVSTKAYITKTFSLTIPRHPYAASRGNYLNLAPYSIYTLRAYPFGIINIDSESISKWNTLDLHIAIDVCTGKAILNICLNGLNNPVQMIETNFGVAIPTTSLNVDYLSLGKASAVSGGAALISKATSGSGTVFQNAKSFVSDLVRGETSIKEVASDVASAAMAAETTVEIRGMQGCASAYLSQPFTLSGRFMPPAPEDFEHKGRPLMQNRIISSLSGFIMCREVDLTLPATDREKSAIENYMKSGFFLE